MMYSLFIRVAIDVQSKDLGFSSQPFAVRVPVARPGRTSIDRLSRQEQVTQECVAANGEQSLASPRKA